MQKSGGPGYSARRPNFLNLPFSPFVLKENEKGNALVGSTLLCNCVTINDWSMNVDMPDQASMNYVRVSQLG